MNTHLDQHKYLLTLSSFMTIILTLSMSFNARAGMMEISGSANFKKVNLSRDVYDESTSITSSISYLFDELSAIEISFTSGQNQRSLGLGATQVPQKTTINYSIWSADFILTLGSRDSILRPYFKVGAGYIIQKSLTTEFEGFPPSTSYDPPAFVPGAGAGLRLLLTKNLSLKLGIDFQASQSMSSSSGRWDYIGRTGLSWLL